MIHIGKLIRQKMEERQRTVVWLAQRLSCSRTNVYKIFDKYSVDTDTLGGSRNLVGIIVSYSHPKFRPLPHGNKSIGGVGSHRASL